MSKLVWDQSGERWYENGTRHGVVYPKTGTTYGNGIAWNGLTGVSENPDGAEPTDLYADDMKYASFRSTETYGITIEAYQYPDEFGECDGTATPSAAPGVIIGQQKRKAFGFVWETQVGNDTKDDSDDAYKLHIAYGLTASPSEKSYETINDSPDAITFSWECESDPEPFTEYNYKPVSCITIDSRTADPTKLTALKDTLFGTQNTEPTLPKPDAIVAALS